MFESTNENEAELTEESFFETEEVGEGSEKFKDIDSWSKLYKVLRETSRVRGSEGAQTGERWLQHIHEFRQGQHDIAEITNSGELRETVKKLFARDADIRSKETVGGLVEFVTGLHSYENIPGETLAHTMQEYIAQKEDEKNGVVDSPSHIMKEEISLPDAIQWQLDALLAAAA